VFVLYFLINHMVVNVNVLRSFMKARIISYVASRLIITIESSRITSLYMKVTKYIVDPL